MHFNSFELFLADRFFHEVQSNSNPEIFVSGIIIEQRNTSSAIPGVPLFHSSLTPPRIVLWLLYPIFVIDRIGSVFAGINKINAAIEYATVRCMPRGTCVCNMALHLTHCKQ
jgi:hypothetical protein